MSKWLPCLLAMFPLFDSSVFADFSNSIVSLHPTYPGSRPFLISISGSWPTDCHPGEQLPVVRSFDGRTVVIEYEIVIVHVTCNEQETAFRSLVDMSEWLNSTQPPGQTLHVSVDFEGAKLEQTLDLECPEGEDCIEYQENELLPERGLYTTPARDREGLLVARQNQTGVLYPLVYDADGGALWLFSAAQFLGGTFFAELIRWQGGACFDCEPADTEAEPSDAGRISVFIEKPDTIWVKLKERPFLEYHKLVYGYDTFDRIEGRALVDLAGRWALSENFGTNPPLGDLSELLPPAFDMTLEFAEETEDGSVIPSVVYRVTSVTGQELGQLVCELQSTRPGYLDGCSFIDPTDQAEPLLYFYPEGPSSLSIEYGRPLPDIGIRPGGKAIRLD